jgi:hypothetical protein
MTEILIDSYSETNQAGDYFSLQSLHPSATTALSAASQCFLTPSKRYGITLAKFHLKKFGSPTGNGHATLYLMTQTYGTDGEPTGSVLATSDAFDVSTLTTDWQLITFKFSGAQRYLMQPNTYYCVCFENPTAGTINVNNFVKVGADSSTPSHTGNSAYFNNSVWFGLDFDDTIFYVYGPFIEGSDFTALMNTFRSNFKGNPSFDVTRSALSLGNRDGTTGWCAKTYTTSTIKMIVIQKESQSLALQMGYWVSLDALGLTIDPIEVYDLVKDGFGRTWEAKTVKPIIIGDTIRFFVCDLKELPLYG